jgi:predicted nuclease of predicted toxin-antitoxin system
VRVLLDEDLPVGLTRYLAPHQAQHVSERGWQGMSNGELLRAAVADGFDVLLTGDAHLPFQQNLGQHDIAVVQVRAGRLTLARLITLAPEIVAAVESAPGRGLSTVSPPDP